VMLAAPRSLTDPWGKFLPALVYHDLSDRLRGQTRRASARWGAIDRPKSPGKLVWVVAGSTRTSVRLAVETARAILARRLDLSIVLTFEAEYPDLLASVGTSARIAFGYAPADYAGSMNAVWRRLLPFAVVLTGVTPRQNLLRLCEACRHTVLIAPPELVRGRFERIYPTHGAAYEGSNTARAADLDVLLLPQPAGSDFGRIADATAGRGLFQWHGADPQVVKRLFALFRGHLPEDVMLVSGPVVRSLIPCSGEVLPLSTWPGTPIGPEQLVLVDDPAWLLAGAADAWAAHFSTPAADAIWQALAAGACVSAEESVLPISPNARAATRRIEDENLLISTWSALSQDRAYRQSVVETSRRAYATEHELAHTAVTELLDRVCSWH
jgi:hypothetical protein